MVFSMCVIFIATLNSENEMYYRKVKKPGLLTRILIQMLLYSGIQYASKKRVSTPPVPIRTCTFFPHFGQPPS